MQQIAVLQNHYDMDEGEYWEPDGTLVGIRTQMRQKTRHLFELQPESITVMEELGEGAFGMVHKGEWAGSPQGTVQVAVKSLHCQEEKSRHQLLEEGAIMGQFSHPNVVRLYGVIDLPDKVCGNIITLLWTHTSRHSDLQPSLRRLCWSWNTSQGEISSISWPSAGRVDYISTCVCWLCRTQYNGNICTSVCIYK